MVKEDAVYRGHAAYRILVADKDVDVEAVLSQVPIVEQSPRMTSFNTSSACDPLGKSPRFGTLFFSIS